MFIPHLASAWLWLLLFVQVGALIHQQVAFDNSDVCWWSLVPPDLICPVLNRQNLTEIVQNLASPYKWDYRRECAGNYCLYSNRGFARGRGIAVITTRDSFEKVMQVGNLFQEYDVSFKHDGDDLPFRIGNTDGKGDGIVARRPLARGDPVMAHTPVLLVHHGVAQDPDAQEHLVKLAFESLPRQTAALFMDQSSHVSEWDRFINTLNTKAFQVNLGGEDGHHNGVYPEAAKMSHDCRPNTAFHIDPTTLMHVTTAVRPIADGEELALSRLNLFESLAGTKVRARKVGESSGCQCSQCALPAEEAAESDSHAREILWIHGQLSKYDTEDVSVGLLTYLLKLYEDERLQCCMAVAYALAATNFNSLGFDKHAVEYASKALEAFRIQPDEEDVVKENLMDLMQDPRGHGSFARRLK